MITISTWSYRGTTVAAVAGGGATATPRTSPTTSASPVQKIDDDLLAVESRVDAERLRMLLDEAIAALPGARRRAVLLRVVEGLDYPELAGELASSPQAARLRVSRGLRTLRRRLAPAHDKDTP